MSTETAIIGLLPLLSAIVAMTLSLYMIVLATRATKALQKIANEIDRLGKTMNRIETSLAALSKP
jgi:uncharacterized protein YoxC